MARSLFFACGGVWAAPFKASAAAKIAEQTGAAFNCGPPCAAGRHAHRVHGALRQLAKQSGQCGPQQRSDLGRSELGRNDGGLLQSGVPRRYAGRKNPATHGGPQLKAAPVCSAILAAALALNGAAQTPPHAKKRLLAGREETAYRHEAVSHARATIERLGRESGLGDTTIRTDTEALTKKKLEYNAPNLNNFDAVLFYTGGTLEMDDRQKADFLSFIHDDGKGFIGVHSATITFTQWPEYGEMIGGYFDEPPWGTFKAPIVVEDPAFPGMSQWPGSFVLREIGRASCRER